MKGDISVETLGAVVIVVITVGVLLSIFRGSAPTSSTSGGEENAPSLGGCQSSDECKENSDGSLCININSGNYFCGCLEDKDCGGKKCVENKCTSAS